MDILIISHKQNRVFEYIKERWSSKLDSFRDDEQSMVLVFGEEPLFIDPIDSYIDLNEEYGHLFEDPYQYDYYCVKFKNIEVLKAFIVESVFLRDTYLDNDRDWVDTVDALENNEDFFLTLMY